eukprot:jgi/Mesvir1/29328/Mv01580-RA.2
MPEQVLRGPLPCILDHGLRVPCAVHRMPCNHATWGLPPAHSGPTWPVLDSSSAWSWMWRLQEVDGDLRDFVQGDGGAKANRFGGANHATKQLAGVLQECSQLTPLERKELLNDEEAMLERAKRNLENFCVLVYEYLPESLEYLSKVYGVKGMKLRPQHYNAGDRRPIKHDRHALIIEENRLDMLLYAYSVELFAARYKAVTGKDLPPKASALSAMAEARAVQAAGRGGGKKSEKVAEASTALVAAAALRGTLPGSSSHAQGGHTAGGGHGSGGGGHGAGGGHGPGHGAKHAPHRPPHQVQVGGISMSLKAKKPAHHGGGHGFPGIQRARDRLHTLAGSFQHQPVGGIFSPSKSLAKREALKAASMVSLQVARSHPVGGPLAISPIAHVTGTTAAALAQHTAPVGPAAKAKSPAVVSAMAGHVVSLGIGSKKATALAHSLGMSNKMPPLHKP